MSTRGTITITTTTMSTIMTMIMSTRTGTITTSPRRSAGRLFS